MHIPSRARGFISLGLILVLIIAAAVIGGGAYYAGKQSPAAQPYVPPSQASTTPSVDGQANNNAAAGNPSQPGTQEPAVSALVHVAPTSGMKPLTVGFILDITNGTNVNSSIDFGDGTSGKVTQFEDTAPAKYQMSLVHTYTSAGTYQVAVTNNSTGRVIGTATIAVQQASQVSQDGAAPIFSVDQTSGTAPLSVSFGAPAAEVEFKDYGIDFGDGSAPSGFNGLCGGLSNAGCGMTHTYASKGTYTAKLVTGANCSTESNICANPAHAQVVSSITITVY